MTAPEAINQNCIVPTNSHAPTEEECGFTTLDETDELNHSVDDSSGPWPWPSHGHDDDILAERSVNGIDRSIVKHAIQNAKSQSELTLDLNGTGIDAIPNELLDLSHLHYLQRLYLKDNLLTSLPDNFFDRLPKLEWLDLRNNQLTCLPSTYIGSHGCLKNLLLQGNRLKTLPLELGHVLTLSGLNTHDNPLQFPPREVLDAGTKAVLAFFRAVLKAKDDNRPLPNYTEIAQSVLSTQHDSDIDISSHITVGLDDIEGYSGTTKVPRQRSSGTTQSSEVNGSQRQLNEAKSDDIERIGKSRNRRSKRDDVSAGRLATVGMTTKHGAPSREEVDRQMSELKLLREKQEGIIQKRKEWAYLKEWRSNGRQLQQEKDRKRIMGKLVYSEPAERAPYAIEKNEMKVLTNEERMKIGKKNLDKVKPRPLSPQTVHMKERERAHQDHRLGERIADHAAAMQQRRLQPQSSPRTEMQLASEELRIAESLHSAIKERRRELQYLN